MVNYNDGKIYKIVDNTNGNIYIGSTCCKLLCQRLRGHKSYYKRYINKKGNQYYSSFEILKNNDSKIELIERVNCETKDELWIDKIKNVNMVKPLQTKKEHYQNNKKNIIKNQKEYVKKNKEYVKKYQKEYKKKNQDYFLKYHKDYYLKYQKENKNTINYYKYQKSWGDLNLINPDIFK